MKVGQEAVTAVATREEFKLYDSLIGVRAREVMSEGGLKETYTEV